MSCLISFLQVNIHVIFMVSAPPRCLIFTGRQSVQVQGAVSTTHPLNSNVTETQICVLFHREMGSVVRRAVCHDHEINCLLRIPNNHRTSHKLKIPVSRVSPHKSLLSTKAIRRSTAVRIFLLLILKIKISGVYESQKCYGMPLTFRVYCTSL
jgi:hypothetical protein